MTSYINNITYIYKENGGPGSAWTIGIKSVNGEYIAIIGSDDIWLSHKLDLQ